MSDDDSLCQRNSGLENIVEGRERKEREEIIEFYKKL